MMPDKQIAMIQCCRFETNQDLIILRHRHLRLAQLKAAMNTQVSRVVRAFFWGPERSLRIVYFSWLAFHLTQMENAGHGCAQRLWGSERLEQWRLVSYEALCFTVAFRRYDSIDGGTGLSDHVHSLKLVSFYGPGPVSSRKLWGSPIWMLVLPTWGSMLRLHVDEFVYTCKSRTLYPVTWSPLRQSVLNSSIRAIT